jgi:hypothetical protein
VDLQPGETEPCLVNIEYLLFHLITTALSSTSLIAIQRFDKPVRMFTVFTDTASQIANFQHTKIDSALGQQSEEVHESRRTFAPVSVMPTYYVYDSQANSRLGITIDPGEISEAWRVLHFGRSAWFAMVSKESSPVSACDIASLAARKSMKAGPREVQDCFHRPIEHRSEKMFLALMQSRLAMAKVISFTRSWALLHEG